MKVNFTVTSGPRGIVHPGRTTSLNTIKANAAINKNSFPNRFYQAGSFHSSINVSKTEEIGDQVDGRQSNNLSLSMSGSKPSI